MGDGGGSSAGQVASLLEQLESAGNVGVPALIKRLGVGTAAVSKPGITGSTVPPGT